MIEMKITRKTMYVMGESPTQDCSSGTQLVAFIVKPRIQPRSTSFIFLKRDRGDIMPLSERTILN